MSRCPGCDHNCRFVPPDGPEPCEFLFIGEKPGREEDARGRPFIGDTGKEFNDNYLRLAGLGRDRIRITNTVKCRLGGNNNKPTPEQVRTCAGHHLVGEMGRCAPRCVVLMGATACSLLPRIELDKDHGIPIEIAPGEAGEFFGDWGGWVIPMFHPAAGLHDTGMMIPLLEDFERLGEWRRGKWKAPCPSSAGEVDYQIVDEKLVLTRLIERGIGKAPAIDTEDDCGRAWSTQFSFQPRTGYLIFGDRTDLLRCLFGAFEEFIFHNAPHDLDIIESLGIKRPTSYRDTMQESYHLGNLPQGLKALSWRLLGIRMQSWEDLVMPDSRKKAIEWLHEQWEVEGERRIRVETQLKTKLKVEYKPNEHERDIKRILSHSHKPDYDIWKKVVEAELGNISPPIPKPSIAHVNLNQAIQYACQDADVTGQVAAELRKRRVELATGDWLIREEDWDK